ncbi:Integrase catalytic domain-containing protein [Citrus sinensis]|nr:Integrase catalytic domain-containing protein [Citrus sinensis]
MVEGETSRIGERSIETISGDTSGGRRDLLNRYLAPIIGGQKIDVENFDGKINFGMCRHKIMDALIQTDVDVVLKNKSHLYDEEIWDRMNEKACGQIRSCLTKEEKYLLKSPENRLHAMSQRYGFRMKPGVSMHDRVSRFEKLLADLKNLDEDIKDEVKAMILLHSLLEEYNHFMTTLIYGKSVIIFNDVCTTLTNLKIRNNDKNSERSSSEALAQKRDKKKPVVANMVRKDEDSDYLLSITPATYVASLSEWILDTGATYHLCPIKEWFTDFRNLESGAVVMGNDQPCRTMGIGTIWFKMYNGMVKELKEVRYVPTLKKNLISMGVLEAKGYKVIIENGTMKFAYRAMVILQGVRRHNLYYLKGGTTDETNVVEVHSDTTKLWHVRLGHAGEKSLQTLMKHGLLKEHMNCTLLEKVRCLLSNADLDKKFWAESVSYASCLINRVPSTAIREVTPRVEEEVVSSDVPQNKETTDDIDNDDFIAIMRPRREIKKSGWLTKDMVVAYALLVIDNDIPNTFDEALRISEKYELELAQLDVKTMFLHGDLEEEIYMTQDCGFKFAGKENHVCRLIKSLYGLKQSPSLLHGAFIYLLLYVNDMPIASKNRDEIERLKKWLASEFEMKDLAPHFKLSSSSCPTSQEEHDYMARVPYASVVGSLMYAMVCTRPNISEAMCIVSRYMYNSSKNHWLAVKWILLYLYGTIDVGLLLKNDGGQQCVGYCDYNFAGDLDKQRSTTGYVFTLGGDPISWRSVCNRQLLCPLWKQSIWQQLRLSRRLYG